MHHGFNGVLFQRAYQSRLIREFPHNQPAGKSRRAVANRKIVVDPDVVAGPRQPAGGMAADVSCPAGNENVHESLLFAEAEIGKRDKHEPYGFSP